MFFLLQQTLRLCLSVFFSQQSNAGKAGGCCCCRAAAAAVCTLPFALSGSVFPAAPKAGMNSLVFRDFELVVCSRSRPADSSAASLPRHRGRAAPSTTQLLMLVRPHGSRREGLARLGRAGPRRAAPGQTGSGYSWCRLGLGYF